MNTSVAPEIAGDETRVDAGASWIDRVRTQPNVQVDEWACEEPNLSIQPAPWVAGGEDDDEGTPVDVRVAAGRTPPLETRFVAGEVDVPTPEPAVEQFEAASIMLGGRADTSDDPPAPAPAARSSTRQKLPSDS